MTTSKNRAKYYIYRNLHKDCFSVKYRGLVIGHYKNLIAEHVEFKVSQVGRENVLREKKKQVHAYVVCKSFKAAGSMLEDMTEHFIYKEVYYNPYKCSQFMVGDKIAHFASTAYLTRNKVFI